MLDFFRKLRDEGRLVFVCVHPNEPFHLEIMREVCERYIFVRDGGLILEDDFDRLAEMEVVRAYLGRLVDAA